MHLEKTTIARSGAVALIASMVFVTAITLLADLVIPVKTWLANTYGHHWVGKGILNLILFAVFMAVTYPLLNRSQCDLSPRMVRMAGHLAILGALIMTLFFVYEYLNH